MATNISQQGRTVELTAPAGGVVSGTPVQIGQVFGIPIASAAVNEKFALMVEGEVRGATKLVTDVVAEGDLLYWDSGNNRLTKTTTGNLLVGWATAPADGSTATVDVYLTGAADIDAA